MLRNTSLNAEPKPVCIMVWEQQRENKRNGYSEFGQIAVNTFGYYLADTGSAQSTQTEPSPNNHS